MQQRTLTVEGKRFTVTMRKEAGGMTFKVYKPGGAQITEAWTAGTAKDVMDETYRSAMLEIQKEKQ
jgi:hypothetical protein